MAGPPSCVSAVVPVPEAWPRSAHCMRREFALQTRGTEFHSVPVGQAGIEPTTSSSRTKRATKLRHCPLRYPSILRSGAWNAGRSCSVDYQFVDASPIHVANGEFEGFCGLSIAGLGDGP